MAAIQQHTGEAKKKTKVRWPGYNTTHDSWLPWSELRHNNVLNACFQAQHLGHLIPWEYQPTLSITNDNQPDDSPNEPSSSTESRSDEGDISNNLHATPIHAAQRNQVNMQKQAKLG